MLDFESCAVIGKTMVGRSPCSPFLQHALRSPCCGFQQFRCKGSPGRFQTKDGEQSFRKHRRGRFELVIFLGWRERIVGLWFCSHCRFSRRSAGAAVIDIDTCIMHPRCRKDQYTNLYNSQEKRGFSANIFRHYCQDRTQLSQQSQAYRVEQITGG